MKSVRDGTTGDTIRAIYPRLLRAWGPQGWWPADTATEMVVGAILTQNTAWPNVERAVKNLAEANRLTWSRLREISQADLAELIRPSGTFRVKALRLKAFVRFLWRFHAGDLDNMLCGNLEEVRKRLLSIHGIGPETADAIILYAGYRPTFVVDAYTRRVLRRHYAIDHRASYESVRALLQQSIRADVGVYQEYHALLVELAKRHCRVKASCDGCPLEDLPHDNAL